MLIPYKRVVLLGCTGFLGKAIHRVFESQRLVVRGYGSAELDLRRFEMLRLLDGQIDGDTVLIVASALTPDKGTTLEALQDNLLMSLNVGRYLEAHAPGLCVYIGSDAVYPLRANPVTEDSPVDPANLYGLAKYCGERILARQAEMRSSPLLVVRLAPLYGWGDTHMSYGPNQFMRSILKDGTVRLFGQGEEQRDHLYIEDGARLILELIRVEATGIINLATGQSYSFKEVIDTLRRTVPVPLTVISVPRKVPVTHRHFDITRLFLATPGFRFTPLEEGLRAYYAAACKVPAVGDPIVSKQDGPRD